MKITVLVPSEDYKNYAGARIRYRRLGPELQRLGISMQLKDIAEFSPDLEKSDVLLISKCHDARALVAAAAAYDRGRLVGVDLFDDYFSQRADSRLARFRTWLSQLVKTCDFALCSTSAMAEVVGTYSTQLPVHVVNDPAPDVPVEELSRLLESKLAVARSERRIRLAWFGVGDNPNFQVGLTDLAAYSEALRTLGNSRMDIELTVLTNARALTAEGLSMIEQIPLRTQIEEWSEERERAVLGETFACFLPVNAQPFSAAKSLNRAVTALSAGCQVISAGYPLYATLGGLIYREGSSFLHDLSKGSMKHSPAGVDSYRGAVQAIASPSAEAAALAGFLTKLEHREPRSEKALALIHGQATNGAAHKAVQAVHGLSIASPYCPAQPNFDVVFRGATGRLTMLVSEKAAKRVGAALRDRLQTTQTISEKKFWVVPETSGIEATPEQSGADWDSAPLPFQLATYRSSVVRMGERIDETFGPCRLLLSESSPLPFVAEL